MPFRRAWPLIVFALLAGAMTALAGEPAASPKQRLEAKRDSGPPLPNTDPDGAVAYYLARRQPLDPSLDPRRALESGRKQWQGMRRYSSRSGRFLEGFRAATGALDSWQWLGPGNVGGRTRALVFHPRRPKIMYAAGVSGGVWKTTNKGRRWTAVGDELANIAVNALAIDPRAPDTLYAGTGEGYFREVVRGTGLPLRGGGIFRTDDGGATWARLPATDNVRFHWVNDLVVSPHDSRRLYAATRKGVFRSLDAGASWRRVVNPKVQGGCLELALRPGAEGDFLFASCGTFERAAVYRHAAAQGPGAWQRVLSEPEMGRTSLAVSPSHPNVVYALAASNVPGPDGRYEQALHAVFRSDAAGAAGSWEARVRNTDSRLVNTLLLSNPVLAVLTSCGFSGPNEFFAMGWYVNVIAVDPTDPDRVWAGGVDLMLSTDGGRNWNPASYWWDDPGQRNYVHADQHGLVFHPRKRGTLYSLNDGGIFRTTNARAAVAADDRALCRPGSSAIRWRALNNNYGVTQFYHGTVAPGGASYLGGTQDNGTVGGADRLGANGWQTVLGGDGGYSAVDPDDPRIQYASVQNGVVFRSVDGGRNFQEATIGIADLRLDDPNDFRATGPGFLFIAPLVMDLGNPERLWLGGRRLWKTENGAGAWTAASAELPNGGKASALAVAPGDSDRVLVGTHVGDLLRSAEATAAGPETVWQASRPRSGFVTSVAFDPGDPDTVYATYGGFGGRHIWRSRDGGVTWDWLDGRRRDGVPDIPVHSIVIDPEDSDRLYLGTDLGVLVSLDGGASWAAENSGFAAAVTEHLVIEGEGAGRSLYAFTHGRGAWRVPL